MQVQEQTDLTVQVQAYLGQEKHCVQRLKGQLQVCKQYCICAAPVFHALGMLYPHT